MLFPSWLRIALDLAGLVLFVGFFAMVAWHGSGVVMQSWTSGSRSQSALETPTVIPQVLWIAGLLAFVVVGTRRCCSMRSGSSRATCAAVARLIGTRSAEEEVEEEIRALKDRQPSGGHA